MADEEEEPPVYVHLLGNDIVPDTITETDSIAQILHWVGFREEAQHITIMDDAFDSFNDIRVLSTKDISKMADSFGNRTIAHGRMIFGTKRTKRLTAIVHWTQDFYRISEDPTIVGLNENVFKSQLDIALSRAEIRRALKDQSSTAASAATPGPLESEKQWKQWEEKFTNYARSHIGAFGVPLSYVIRNNDNPTDAIEVADDFVSKTVAHAPLSGEYYNADRSAVFNMIVSFTTGQPSDAWVKSTHRHANGRTSMKALRDHFSGEGNASRNISEADRLKESLHYKSERSLAFETFLTQCQKMYTIYDKEAEPMADDAKLRFLFKRVQHPGLQQAIEALKAQQTAGTAVTYTMAANHLTTAVSALPEYISKNRNISAVTRTGGDTNGGSSEIYRDDGTINTGYIPSWKTLSQDDKNIVMNERKRLSKRGGKGGKSGSVKHKSASNSNRLKQLEDQNKKYKRAIKSLKRRPSEAENGDDKDSDDKSEDDDAGDQFGGRNSKRLNKSKN